LGKSVGAGSGARSGAPEGASPRNQRGTVKSADRVLTLFELLGRWNREISHAEIAEMLGIPKSSLTQLLKNLVARGWLAYSPPTKGYFLGDAITSLARGAVQKRELADLARPILMEATAASGETTELHILRGHSIVVAASASSPAQLMALMRIGDTAPLYAVGGGKAILAALPEDMREEYYATVKLEPLTAKTVRSVQELRIQIEAVQREGIGYCFEEYTQGVIGTARAIRGPDGVVVGAFDSPTPAIRYDKATAARIASALEEAVAKMQRQLAFGGPPGQLQATHIAAAEQAAREETGGKVGTA
jgi:DNA-binding IclR family transcriptional regulator